MIKTVFSFFFNFLKKTGLFINLIVTYAILIIVYYLIFTPVGIFLRLAKKDLLDIKIDKNKASYWIESVSAQKIQESYLKQY